MTSTFPIMPIPIVSYGVWAVSSCFISPARNGAELSRRFKPAVKLFDSQNETSGALILNAGAAGAPHCALINTPLKRVVALNVKSTGWPAFGLVKVAVTGLNVPGVKAGMLTIAFVALTNV